MLPNRPTGWPEERGAEIALNEEEVRHFQRVIDELILSHGEDIRTGFIAESAEKLRRLPAYYAALNGTGDLPSVRCNAPWVSAVIEADGNVRPCFFHKQGAWEISTRHHSKRLHRERGFVLPEAAQCRQRPDLPEVRLKHCM